MSAYARIQAGVVAELFTPPAGFTLAECFAPSVAAQFAPVPPGVTPAPGWTASEAGGVWTFAAPVAPAPTVAGAIAALGALLAQKQAAGVFFTPTGAASPVLFPTAAASQPLLLGAWSALNASPPLAADGDTYLAAGGTPVALSMTDAKAMLAKALAYFRTCNARYAALHAAVAANPATDITAGWPANT